MGALVDAAVRPGPLAHLPALQQQQQQQQHGWLKLALSLSATRLQPLTQEMVTSAPAAGPAAAAPAAEAAAQAASAEAEKASAEVRTNVGGAEGWSHCTVLATRWRRLHRYSRLALSLGGS